MKAIRWAVVSSAFLAACEVDTLDRVGSFVPTIDAGGDFGSPDLDPRDAGLVDTAADVAGDVAVDVVETVSPWPPGVEEYAGSVDTCLAEGAQSMDRRARPRDFFLALLAHADRCASGRDPVACIRNAIGGEWELAPACADCEARYAICVATLPECVNTCRTNPDSFDCIWCRAQADGDACNVGFEECSGMPVWRPEDAECGIDINIADGPWNDCVGSTDDWTECTDAAWQGRVGRGLDDDCGLCVRRLSACVLEQMPACLISYESRRSTECYIEWGASDCDEQFDLCKGV